MFLHILTDTKKEDYDKLNRLSYIRVLGFNTSGKKYLKEIKKDSIIPIITNYHELNDDILNNELKINYIYNYLINHEELNLIELKSIPVNKK